MAYGVTLQRTPPLRLPAHAAQPKPEDWHTWALAQSRPRAVDLFAGGGGLSLGIEQAGYRVVLAVDSNPSALETHSHNFPGLAVDLDLSSKADLAQLVELLDGIEIDLIAGGPPCQPFSKAGRSKIRSLVQDGVRDATDRRRELWRSFLHVVEQVRPRAVLMENVPDMALTDDLRAVRSMQASLEEIGYEVNFRLLDAWRYGVPQHRQRLILVALRDAAEFQWPVERPPVNVAQAISDLPRLDGTTGDRELPYHRAYSDFQRSARRDMGRHRRVVWDHVSRPVRKDDREAFEFMTPQTRYSELPTRLRRYRDDIFDDKYKRLAWDSLSRSITAHIAKDGYWYIHPGEPRTLSVREAARIQSFPDHFRFAGTRSSAFAQIGNAVPPALAREVVSSIRQATQRPSPVRPRFGTQWLRDVRTLLHAWGERDRQRHPWRHPGDPWKVASGVLLGARTVDAVRQFLERFPTSGDVTSARTRVFAAPLKPRAADAVRRLSRAARRWSSAKTSDDLIKLLKPTHAELSQLTFLIGRSDGILTTTASLRVVARLTQTNVDRKRCGSDGRLSIGRIIGSGTDVANLSAALHALGSDICTVGEPSCAVCPLARVCPSARARLSV